MPQQGAQGARRDVAREREVLFVTWVAAGAEGGEVRRGTAGLGPGEQGEMDRAPPVLQQQGPQHVSSVLSLDLVRDDHLLHHLVGHPREGLLIQVQEYSPWNQDGMEGPSSLGKTKGAGGRVGELGKEGDSQAKCSV